MSTKSSAPDISGFMTTAEVAEHYGIKARQVQYAIKEKLVPAQKLGWQWVIWRGDLPKEWPTLSE